MKHFIFATLLLSFFSFTVPTDAYSETILVGFKSGKEPYVMASIPPKDSDYDLSENLGIEIDIVREVFAMYGKEIRPIYMNFERMKKQISDGEIDLAANLFPGVEGVHYTNEYIHLHDHLIFNAKLGSNIKSIADLSGKRVVAFQSASKYLGAEYKKATETFSSYKEMVKQKSQAQILLSGRTDAIILDIGIFKHWAKQFAKPGDKFTYIPMGKDPFFFSAGFKDPALRDQFAEGMKKLRASGRYDEIYAKYLD